MTPFGPCSLHEVSSIVRLCLTRQLVSCSPQREITEKYFIAVSGNQNNKQTKDFLEREKKLMQICEMSSMNTILWMECGCRTGFP